MQGPPAESLSALTTRLLRHAGWSESEDNDEETYITESKGEQWQVSPISDSALSLRTTGRKGVFAYDVQARCTESSAAEVVSALVRARRAAEPVETLFAHWLKLPKTKVALRKYVQVADKSVRLSKILTPRSLEQLRSPGFETITKRAFGFYLARLIDSSILIRKRDFAALLRALPRNKSEEPPNDFIAYLDDRLSGPKLQRNRAGDILNIEQGGDLWILSDLHAVRAFVGAGSFILLQTDSFVIYRVEYGGGEVRYLREHLKNWKHTTK